LAIGFTAAPPRRDPGIGIAHVGLQHVHGLVPRHVPHLEYPCAAAARAGQEAGPQGMGAEVSRLEPNPLGIGLDALQTL
jgi:hypothetical protein